MSDFEIGLISSLSTSLTECEGEAVILRELQDIYEFVKKDTANIKSMVELDVVTLLVDSLKEMKADTQQRTVKLLVYLIPTSISLKLVKIEDDIEKFLNIIVGVNSPTITKDEWKDVIAVVENLEKYPKKQISTSAAEIKTQLLPKLTQEPPPQKTLPEKKDEYLWGKNIFTIIQRAGGGIRSENIQALNTLMEIAYNAPLTRTEIVKEVFARNYPSGKCPLRSDLISELYEIGSDMFNTLIYRLYGGDLMAKKTVIDFFTCIATCREHNNRSMNTEVFRVIFNQLKDWLGPSDSGDTSTEEYILSILRFLNVLIANCNSNSNNLLSIVKNPSANILSSLYNMILQFNEISNKAINNSSEPTKLSESFPNLLRNIFKQTCLLIETICLHGALKIENIGKVNIFLQFASPLKIPEIIVDTITTLEKIRVKVDPSNVAGSQPVPSTDKVKQFAEFIFRSLSILSSALVLLLQCSKESDAEKDFKVDQYVKGINLPSLIRLIHVNALNRAQRIQSSSSDTRIVKMEEGEAFKHELLHSLIARNSLLQMSTGFLFLPYGGVKVPPFIWKQESYSCTQTSDRIFTFGTNCFAFLSKKITEGIHQWTLRWNSVPSTLYVGVANSVYIYTCLHNNYHAPNGYGNCYCSNGNVYYGGGSAVGTTSYTTNTVITIEIDMNVKRVRYFREKVQQPYYIQGVPAGVFFYAFGYSGAILETLSLEETNKSLSTGDQNAADFGS